MIFCFSTLIFTQVSDKGDIKNFNDYKNDMYFGKKPPGLTPQLFIPEININEGYNIGGNFSNDFKYFCFINVYQKYGEWNFIEHQINIKNGKWTQPRPLAEAFNTSIRYPFFHPKENKVFFGVYVGPDTLYERDMDIYVADFRNNSISNKKLLSSSVNSASPERHPSVSADGDIYFYSYRKEGFGDADLYYSEFVNGEYKPAKNMGPHINSEKGDYNPSISPCGNILVFNSIYRENDKRNDHDIYVAFRKKDGSWSKAVNAGDVINTEYIESKAVITPDGKYLLFSSNKDSDNGFHNIYWVDIKIFDEIKKNIVD